MVHLGSWYRFTQVYQRMWLVSIARDLGTRESGVVVRRNGESDNLPYDMKTNLYKYPIPACSKKMNSYMKKKLCEAD